MHPKQLQIAHFTYPLPPQRIAQFPLAERHDAKLLLYKKGQLSHSVFNQLHVHLPEDACLVYNNSKVIEARLLFQKPSGGKVEIFMLEPAHADVAAGMQATAGIDCWCIVGGLAKWKGNDTLTQTFTTPTGDAIELRARLLQRGSDVHLVRFDWDPPELCFAELLHAVGHLPIPPYLQRAAQASDAERYQTVYAQSWGSVAAPTAGLHFTPTVLQNLKDANFGQVWVTLHVGAGTFKPVKATHIADHSMHAEYIDVSVQALAQLATQTCVIPVGTTSMRTLESLYWMGLKAHQRPNATMQQLCITQWEIYDDAALLNAELSAADALHALMEWMKRENFDRLVCKTQIMIAPGYVFKICKGLITNFHQPQSTLLLLIAALLGPSWKAVYDYALQNDFRFLSYGDSSLLLP
ncbi:MAG: S-adenosylmethionine:tRNA ribosyltransferase-isomerase [Bacteroidetes bacterium]|nr:MAG: S-adenosylmethionine:tRNA ribosyltransferase-isomerase [Bacteroidota bacterium]